MCVHICVDAPVREMCQTVIAFICTRACIIQDGAEIYAYYLVKTFFNPAAAAAAHDAATMTAITTWNTKFLETQDDNKQWSDRKTLWKAFATALER